MRLHTITLGEDRRHDVAIATESECGTVIVVELTDADRENIAAMHPECVLYAQLQECDATAANDALDILREEIDA